jgi:hypothetical protein
MTNTWPYLQDPRHWKTIATRFPKFAEEVPLLVKTLYECFERTTEFNDQQLAVFGLGRLCVEDFLEGLVLCENGLGYAGLKLLRGMYERAVTAEYISTYPNEAQLFSDYFYVQWKKLADRGRQVYGDDAPVEAEADNLAKYAAVKDKFDLGECDKCLMRKQGGWSKYSLDALAMKVSNIWKERFGYAKKAPNQLHRAYLFYADLANIHIHASMFSIRTRLRVGTDGVLAFSASQEREVEQVLSSAHAMTLVVIETQNRYFDLGLADRLTQLRAHCAEIWLTGPESN